MTRYLLDTNIVSATIKPAISATLNVWLGAQADEDLWIATLTIAELWRGIVGSPTGRRRTELEAWFAGPTGPRMVFRGRVLAFDELAALEWGHIIAEGRRAGRPRSPLDMIIAATAIVHDCVVVTANQRHFEGVVAFFNPLASAS